MTFEKYMERKIVRRLKKWIVGLLDERIQFGYDGPPLTVEEFSAAVGGKLGRTAIYDRVRSGAIKKVPGETDVVLIPRTELKRYFEGKTS